MFNILVVPNFVLWYLLALIYWRLLVLYIPPHILQKRYLIIIVSVCISLAAGFMPIGKQFAIQRSLAFLPFFIMGFYFAEFDIRKYINKIPEVLAVVTLGLFLVLFCLYGNCNIKQIISCTFPYWAENTAHTLFNFIGRFVYIVSAFLLGILVMRIIPSYKLLARWGQMTLFIFIYHSFLVKILLDFSNAGLIPNGLFPIMGYSFIITMGLILLFHVKLLQILLNPFSYQKNKKIKNS